MTVGRMTIDRRPEMTFQMMLWLEYKRPLRDWTEAMHMQRSKRDLPNEQTTITNRRPEASRLTIRGQAYLAARLEWIRCSMEKENFFFLRRHEQIPLAASWVIPAKPLCNRMIGSRYHHLQSAGLYGSLNCADVDGRWLSDSRPGR